MISWHKNELVRPGRNEGLLSVKELRRWLSYNPETGLFTWLVRRNNNCPAGSSAGATNKPYIVISINNRNYMAHRIAWAMVHGAWPADYIDHVNGNKHDNRMVNLRSATRSQNAANIAYRRGTTSKYRGVHWCKTFQKWTAQVYKDRRVVWRAYFNTEEAAHQAYLIQAKDVHGEFCPQIIDQLRKLDAPSPERVKEEA